MLYNSSYIIEYIVELRYIYVFVSICTNTVMQVQNRNWNWNWKWGMETLLKLSLYSRYQGSSI